jgi:hypothetical protein
MMDWRPIETAPRDGTEVVGAEWQEAEGYPPELQTACTRYFDGAWRYRSGFDWTPAYWMPLPGNQLHKK